MIRAFHAVMATGSLSAAARALGQAQPTLRRHVEALEQELGTVLFTRAGNGLTPTPLAQELMPVAEAVVSQAEAFARSASSAAQARTGTVRVTASRVLATHVLPRLLAGLRRAEPGIVLELTATDLSENLLHRAADIAIRMAPPIQGALVARKLPAVPLGIFAAPSLVQQGISLDLRDMPFVSDDRTQAISAGFRATGLPEPGNVVLRCDDPVSQIEAIRAGIGAGICQTGIAVGMGLVRLLPKVGMSLPCYLVMHEDLSRIARIRTVFDHLAQELPAVLRPDSWDRGDGGVMIREPPTGA